MAGTGSVDAGFGVQHMSTPAILTESRPPNTMPHPHRRMATRSLPHNLHCKGTPAPARGIRENGSTGSGLLLWASCPDLSG